MTVTEQASLAKFQPAPLSSREHDLYRTLRTHLHLNREATFTVDTLRMLQFDRFVQKDKLGRINYGSLIGKWHFYKLVERTGKTVCSQLPSNHGHREQVWKIVEEEGEKQSCVKES